jgi:acetyltransferase-like isoleucine patch superfamily enzyme
MPSIKATVRDLLPDALLHGLAATRRAAAVALLKKQRIGPGSHVDPTVHVLGWESVRIGANTVLSEHSWLNVNHRADPAIEIGDHCFIGKRNFFSSGARISIGDYCLTTLDCKFIGSSHHYEDPFRPYVTTGTLGRDTIVVGTNCMFNVGSVVLGDVHIGHGSVIGSGALIDEDVPPFSLVVGNPARVVKRYDMSANRWRRTAEVSEEALARLPDESTYRTQLRSRYGAVALPSAAAGCASGDLP